MESQRAAEPGFFSKTSLIQLGYGVWLNLTLVGVGMTYGWAAVAVPQLLESASPIHCTQMQQSWIASVLTLAAPAGCLVSGYIMDKFGRRTMLYICQIPMAAGWFVTAFAKSPTGIITGRLITGVGIGMGFGAPPLYMSEVSRPNMRGVVGAFPNLALSLGVTLQAVFGSFFTWRVLGYSCAIYALVLLVCNLFLPETPYFMLTKDSEDLARKSLKRFRSKDYDIEPELAAIIDFKRNHRIHKLPFKEQVRCAFKKSTCRIFGIVITYFLFMQLSGAAIIIMWTVAILEHSKSSVDAHLGNVLLSVTRGVVGIVTSILMFRVGRRPMALTSAFGVGVVCIFLGIFLHNITKVTVIPQICFMLYALFASVGYYTIPFLLMCEVYPLQVRGLLSGLTVCMHNLLVFAANFDFPYVRDAIGLDNTILSFGIVSLIGFLFLYFFLPETKGLTLQEIEELFEMGRSPRIAVLRKKLQMQAASKQTPTGSKESDKKNDKEITKDNKSKNGEGTSKVPDDRKDGTGTEKTGSDNPTQSKGKHN